MSQSVESLRKSGTKVRVIHLRWLTPISERSTSILNMTFSGFSPENLSEAQSLFTRREAEELGYNWRPNPRGGATIVEVTKPDGETSYGVSWCNDNDNFNHKAGCVQALNRALNLAPPLKFNKEVKNYTLELLIKNVLGQ